MTCQPLSGRYLETQNAQKSKIHMHQWQMECHSSSLLEQFEGTQFHLLYQGKVHIGLSKLLQGPHQLQNRWQDFRYLCNFKNQWRPARTCLQYLKGMRSRGDPSTKRLAEQSGQLEFQTSAWGPDEHQPNPKMFQGIAWWDYLLPE